MRSRTEQAFAGAATVEPVKLPAGRDRVLARLRALEAAGGEPGPDPGTSAAAAASPAGGPRAERQASGAEQAPGWPWGTGVALLVLAAGWGAVRTTGLPWAPLGGVAAVAVGRGVTMAAGWAEGARLRREQAAFALLRHATALVAAGQGFESALGTALLAGRLDRKLRAELLRYLQERRIGRPRDQALAALAARTRLAPLRVLAAAAGELADGQAQAGVLAGLLEDLGAAWLVRDRVRVQRAAAAMVEVAATAATLSAWLIVH